MIVENSIHESSQQNISNGNEFLRNVDVTHPARDRTVKRQETPQVEPLVDVTHSDARSESGVRGILQLCIAAVVKTQIHQV